MSDDKNRGKRDPYFGPDDRNNPTDNTYDDRRYHHTDERSHIDDGRRPQNNHHYRADDRIDHRRANRAHTDTGHTQSRPHREDNRTPRYQNPRESRPHSGGREDYRGEDYRSEDYEETHGAQRVTYPVVFHGNASEYFKIWIVNIFLTVITLYVYSAWAKVRTKRYFHGNTTIDGSSFEYHARGGQLVVGRLIATALFVIYTFFQGINWKLSLAALGIIVVMFPWAVWRSLRFNAKATSFRNIHFGFDGKASPPYLNLVVIPGIILTAVGVAAYFIANQNGINIDEISNIPPHMFNYIGAGILGVLSLLIVFIIPMLHRNLLSYSLNNHRYGTARFAANIKVGKVYGIHFVTFLLTLFALFVVGGVIAGLFKILFESSDFLDSSELLTRLEPYSDLLAGLTIYLVAIPVGGLAVAFFKSAIRNHRYNATSIDSRVNLTSTAGTWSLWWLNISNLFLLIITLGFAYPFTKIRTARYFANRTTVTVAGGLNSFAERERTRLNAMGEEMADAFDVEFDIGI